jgi:hypothetical protein
MPQTNKKPLKEKNVTVADTVKTMRDKGVEVSEKDAELILEFLFYLAKLSVDQYVNNLSNDIKQP